MKRWIVLGALLSTLAASSGAAQEAEQGPTAVLEQVRTVVPPLRDPADLRQRIAPAAGFEQAQRQIGPGQLWVLDFRDRAYRPVEVELRSSTLHADWYVERGRESGDLTAAAEYFEQRIFPLASELTGGAWTPGERGQPRIGIYSGRVRGVAGYMSVNDAYPRSVYPYSNEQPFVYLNLDSVRPGTREYSATLAHEIEHLAHAQLNPTQEGWLDEGLAELFANLATGGSAPRLETFRREPDVQLTAWGTSPDNSAAHYQASFLWARYLMERGGGPAALPLLAQVGGRGLETVDRFASATGAGSSAETLFLDWLVANLLDEPGSDGRYGYQGLDQRSTARTDLQLSGPTVEAQTYQFAAGYFQLPAAGPADLTVEINPTVPLVENGEADAAYWSLRGDNLDTRLTRQFDLSGLASASLSFRLWFDLEPGYDACQVLGSRDGSLWTALEGRWTTTDSQLGQLFGPIYSGSDGPRAGWRDEAIDLTPFAGGPAFVRFECVTDQSTSFQGLVVDDLAIPELGFFDDAEADRGWTAEGFVRAPNQMSQPAAVLLVQREQDAVSVDAVGLDPAGRGAIRLEAVGPTVERYLVVAGLAPRTLSPLSYRLRLEPAPG